MAKGIVIDVGFKPDIKKFEQEIERDFKNIDFENYLNLDEAFDKQKVEVEKKLAELKRVIDETINGKLDNKPVEQMSELQKAVGELAKNMKAMQDAMPKSMANRFNQSLNTVVGEVNELNNCVENLTTTTRELQNVSNNGLSFFNNNNTEEVKQLQKDYRDLFKIINDLQSAYDKVGSLNIDEDNKSAVKAEKALKSIESLYTQALTAQQVYYDATDEPDKEAIVKTAKNYSLLLSNLSEAIQKFSKYGGDLSEELSLDFKTPVDVRAAKNLIEENFDEVKGYLQDKLDDLFSVGVDKYNIDLSASLLKGLKIEEDQGIKVPIGISTKPKTLHSEALAVIQYAQEKLKNTPLQVEVQLYSSHRSNANQKRLKEIQDSLKNVDIGNDELKQRLNTLIDDMYTGIEKELTFEAKINTESALNSVKRFQNNVNAIMDELSTKLKIYPTVELKDDTRIELQNQLDEAVGDKFKIDLNIIGGDNKHEEAYLDKLKNSTNALKRSINNAERAVRLYSSEVVSSLQSVSSELSNIIGLFNQMPKSLLGKVNSKIVSEITNDKTEDLLRQARESVNKTNGKDKKNSSQNVIYHLNLDISDFNNNYQWVFERLENLKNQDVIVNIRGLIDKSSFELPILSFDKNPNRNSQVDDLSSILDAMELFKNNANYSFKNRIQSDQNLFGALADFGAITDELKKILSDAGIIPDKLERALKRTGFLDDKGSLNFELNQAGSLVDTGVIGNKYVILGRNNDYGHGYSLEEGINRQKDIDELVDQGVNIARVVLIRAKNGLEKISDDQVYDIYEVQEKKNGINHTKVVDEVVNMTEEQILSFFRDVKLILDKGFVFETGGDNFLFDADGGLVPIDLAKIGDNYEEIVQSLGGMRDYLLRLITEEYSGDATDFYKRIGRAYNEVNKESLEKTRQIKQNEKENYPESSSSKIDKEISKFQELESAVDKVTEAIERKNDAIKTESDVVDSSINSEITALSHLEKSRDSNIESPISSGQNANENAVSKVEERLERLKSTFADFKMYFHNNELDTEAGSRAALAYYNAYKEALEAKINKKDLKENTIDGKVGNLFTGNYSQYKKGEADLDLTGIESEISKYQEAVNKFDNPEVVNAIKQITSAIEQMMQSGDGGEKTIELLKQLNTTIKQLGSDKSDDKIQKITTHLGNFKDAIDQLDIKDNGFVTQLNNILVKGEELKALGKVLESSQRQINAAEKAVRDKEGYDRSAKYLQNNEDKIREKVNKLIGVETNGYDVIYQKLEATKKGWIQVVQLISDANGELKKYTATVNTRGKVEMRGVNNSQPELARDKKAYENWKRLNEAAIPGATNLGSDYETFTPNSANWGKLVQKAAEFNIELKDIEKIVRTVDELGHESFQVFTSLSRVTLGMNSELVLYRKDDVLDVNKAFETFKKTITSTGQLFGKAFKGGNVAVEQIADNLGKIQASYNTAKSLFDKGLINQDQFDELNKYIDALNDDLKNFAFKGIDDKLSKHNYVDLLISDINSAKSEFLELSNVINKVKTGQPLDSQDLDTIRNYSSNISLLNNKLSDTSEQFAKVTSASKLLIKVEKILAENTAMSKELRQQFEALAIQLRAAGDNVPVPEFNKLTETFLKLNAQLERSRKKGKSFFDMFKNDIIQKSAGTLAQYFSLYDIIRYGREAVQVVQQYNDALIEMQKVSDETTDSLKKYQDASYDVANSIGSSALQLQQSTASWLRLGESLEEASESSRVATILNNVSEFESIDDATTSLVAMAQAYDDLDKIDIVDKLNNVGNNYAISTSELAESMQRSAATLKVVGNDIDEAIALTTAGNSILQDPDKVGNGLRVISLRIAGTEVAQEELEDLGEETDDVVHTASKLQDTIKQLTAVSSNGKQGFDILDDNGNYKSTYEILLGISEVYQEILDEDKQFGTNRASALVETLGGKNRASVVASILQNGDILKNAYKSSQNSEGSAQEELDKYLESITAKTEQFKNAVQELINDAIDSGVIGDIIDFGTKLVNILDSLVEITGKLSVPIAGGSIFGIIYGMKKDDTGTSNFKLLIDQPRRLFKIA